MDVQQFLAEFGYIANAPGGIAKLRELVIQLAISGKLVERIATETTVSDAIEAAAAMRLAYETEFDLRATRAHPPMEKSPFAVPDHWQWARMEQICLYIQRGKGPKYVEQSSTYVISQKCVQWSGFDLTPARFVSEDSLDSYGKERFLCSGDLLWNSTGTGTAGRVAIYQQGESIRAVADSHVTVIRVANFSPRYIWCVIASPWVQSRIEPSHPASLVSGSTQQVELATSTARALPIPCPPPEEQSRIIAKVDELMALCSKLEVQQQDRRKLQNNLRQSTLQAVAAASSPHELQTTWVRLADNFGRLFQGPEDVAELRALVMDLAIRGLLVEPNDQAIRPSIDERQLEIRREELRKAKAIRASRPVGLPHYFEEPFPLPSGWKWFSLDQICYQITDGTHHTPQYVTSGVPFISVKDLSGGLIDFSSTKFVSQETHAELVKRCNPEFGDILLTKVGTTGIAKMVDTQKPFSLFVSVALLKFPQEFVDPHFLELLISSPFVKRQSEGGTRGIGNKNLVLNTIKGFLIPLPPISEQKLILTKAAELIKFCDRLESQLRSSTELLGRLAIAAVSSIAGISTEQEEEEPVKAPQTELIAPLRLGQMPDIKAQAPLATILTRHHGEMSAKDLWQRFGGEIDAFYAQLKIEVAHGWILEPETAVMREKEPA